MKSLSAKTFQCGVTVQGLTTLSGTVYLTALTNTATWDYVVVGTTAQGQLYTRTYAQLMSDITSGIGLSGYVPTSRTLTINGVSYDLTANRSWTISTVDYTSRLQHQVKAGVAINKGQAVYVTSADGTNMIVGLASNASEATSSKTMGLLDATVSTNGFANVVTEGLLAGLDTSTAGTEGDPVWLGTGGNLIYGLINKPYAPAHLVFIGIVTRKNANNGEIFVKVQNGFELKEIHDVDLITSAPTAGQLLRYNSDGLWKNWSPNYLTAEADTLATVTGRGATTNTSITVGPDLIVQADGSVNYTASRLWLNSHNNYRGAGVHMSGVGSTWFAGTPYTDFDGGYVIARTGTSNDVSSAQYSNALLTVKSSGNVGIGTSSPSHNLHLYGAGDRIIKIENTGTYLMYVGLLSNEGYIGSTNATPLGFYTNNVNRIYINTSGNVGIGTTSPASRFQSNNVSTYNSSTPTGAILASNLAGGNAVIDIGVDATYLGYIQSRNILNTTPYNLLLNPIGGNVGIGTTTTGSKLHVLLNGNTSGGPTGNVASFQNSSPGNNAYISLFGAYNAEAGIIFTDESEQYKGKIGYNNISEYMYFQTDGSEKVRITAAGNVGIGTTAPAEKLHVTQNIALGLTGGSIGDTNNILFPTVNGTHAGVPNGIYYTKKGNWGGQIDIRTSYDWGYSTDNAKISLNGAEGNGITFSTGASALGSTERVRITYDGNVGIGTTGPAAALHTIGTGIVNIVQSSNDVSYTQYYNTSTGGGGTGNGLTVGVNGLDAYVFNREISNLILGTADTEAIRITSTQNVGIGTTDTNLARLRVIGQGGVGNAAIMSDYGNTAVLGEVSTIAHRGGQWHTLYVSESGGSATNAVYVTGTKPVILNAGNVGIGTTSPGYKLDISTTSGTSVFRTSDTTTAYKSFSIDYSSSFITQVNFGLFGRFEYEGNGGVLSIENRSTQAGSSMMRFVMGTTERMRITDTGNVGIGTTSPAYKLDVNGSIRTSGVNGLYIDASANFGDNSGANFDILNLGSTRALRILATTVGGWGNILLNPYGANVGIGTTAPTNRLQIGSIGSSGYGGNDLAIGNGTQVMAFYQSATVSTWYTNTSFSLMPSGSGSVGYVGIGTLTPSTLLDVSGVITATGGNSTNWNTAYGWGNHASASYVPQARTLTINGTSYDLSANRSWTIATTTPGGSDTQVQYNSSGSLAGASALTYNSTTNRVGINQASPGYDLDVNGQVRVQDKLRIGTGNGVVHMSSTATINASATTVVWAQTVSVGMCAFIEYYILNNNSLTDQRAGTIMVTWNQSGTPTIAHTETTTPDIGSTTSINFTSSLVGSDARINAVNSSANPYTIVMSYKYF
jgi:hypothetical protein